ncbi:MAG: hypothetical protein NW218_11545 [Saprospiraceae bacterium]|nr:hypothetical protein [Saprospiraceae bacterium]
MKKVIHISIGLLFCCVMEAQNPEIDLQQVLKVLTESKNLYFENRCYYYEQGYVFPSDSLNGVYHKSNGFNYAQMGAVEVIGFKNLVVSVDHEEKLMMVNKLVESAPQQNLFNPELLRTLIRPQAMKTKFISFEKSSRTIQIDDLENPEHMIQVQYEPITWNLKKVRLTGFDSQNSEGEGPAPKVTIEVEYLHLSTVPKTFPYKLEQFVVKSGKSFKPAGKYKGYRIVSTGEN